jgi:hypothetical protein
MMKWSLVMLSILIFFQLQAQEVIRDERGSTRLKVSSGLTLDPQILTSEYLLFHNYGNSSCGLYLVHCSDDSKPVVCLSKTKYVQVAAIPNDLIFLQKDSLWAVFQFDTTALQLKQILPHEYTLCSKRGQMLILEKNGKSGFYAYDPKVGKLTQVFPHEFTRLAFSNYGRYVFVQKQKKHGLYVYDPGLQKLNKAVPVRFDTIYDTRNKMFVGVKYKDVGRGYGQKYKYNEKNQHIIRKGRVKMTPKYISKPYDKVTK